MFICDKCGETINSTSLHNCPNVWKDDYGYPVYPTYPSVMSQDALILEKLDEIIELLKRLV